nr:NUDIX domain-containing protein [uncultured Butyrivibrio sp.]
MIKKEVENNGTCSEAFEKSCGAIVYKIEDGVIKYLLVEEASGFHSFPKGHMENEETEEETALREIKEETNLDATLISGFRESEQYKPAEKPGVTKQVIYFLAQYTDEIPQVTRPQEVRSLKSLSLEEALGVIEHVNKKEILLRADEFIKKEM